MSFRFSILVARRVYRKIGYKILDKRDLENYKNSGKIYVTNIEKTLVQVNFFNDIGEDQYENSKESIASFISEKYIKV